MVKRHTYPLTIFAQNTAFDVSLRASAGFFFPDYDMSPNEASFADGTFRPQVVILGNIYTEIEFSCK